VKRLPRVDSIDVVAITGLACLAAGLALVYVPAAFVVVGAFLLLYAVLAQRSGGPTP
jgi:hypothetical protein